MDSKFSLSFSAPIFQIKVAPYLNRLGLEIRHAESRAVEYVVVDMEIEGAQWSSGPEEWWTSLFALREEVLLLCRYEDPALPVHKGVEFRKLPDFSLLYSHPDAKIIANTAQGTLLELSPGNLVSIEPNGLDVVPLDGSEEELLAAMGNAYWEASLAQIRAPFHSPAELHDQFPIFLEHPPTLPHVHQVEADGKQFLAWHSGFEAGSYSLHIACFLNDMMVWSETIETGMQSLNPEPFFLAHGRIIWLEGRTTLSWREI